MSDKHVKKGREPVMMHDPLAWLAEDMALSDETPDVVPTAVAEDTVDEVMEADMSYPDDLTTAALDAESDIEDEPVLPHAETDAEMVVDALPEVTASDHATVNTQPIDDIEEDGWGFFGSEPEPSAEATPAVAASVTAIEEDGWGMFGDDDDIGSADVIDLGCSLTFADLEAMHASIVHAFETGRVAINAQRLDRIDAAGVQLICVLALSAKRDQVQLDWCGVSDKFYEAVNLLGLQDSLALPAAA